MGYFHYTHPKYRTLIDGAPPPSLPSRLFPTPIVNGPSSLLPPLLQAPNLHYPHPSANLAVGLTHGPGLRRTPAGMLSLIPPVSSATGMPNILNSIASSMALDLETTMRGMGLPTNGRGGRETISMFGNTNANQNLNPNVNIHVNVNSNAHLNGNNHSATKIDTTNLSMNGVPMMRVRRRGLNGMPKLVMDGMNETNDGKLPNNRNPTNQLPNSSEWTNPSHQNHNMNHTMNTPNATQTTTPTARAKLSMEQARMLAQLMFDAAYGKKKEK